MRNHSAWFGWKIVVAVFALLTSTTVATVSTISPAGAASQPYVIGFEGGLTGAIAPVPAQMLLGEKAYFAMINAKGGIDGHHINVVALDDTGLDTALGIANFTRFADSIHPSAIIGPSYSGMTDAATPTIQSAQIPTLVGAATTPEEAHSYIFGVDIRFAQEGTEEIQEVKDLHSSGSPTPSIADFYADSPDAISLGQAIKEGAAANGWKVALNSEIPLPPPDSMLTQAQQVISSKANYVLGGLFLALPPLFMQSLKTLGFTGTVINYHGGATLSQVKQINNPKYYVLRSWAYDTSKEPGVQLMDKWARSVGGDPSGDYVPAGWGSAALAAKALQSCQYPCTGPKMKTALDHVGVIGTLGGLFSGPLGFPPGSHQAVNYSQLWHYVNGHAVPVGPVLKAPS